MNDRQLLQAYVADRSEDAFRELVQRHVALVHGVARRQPGIDPHRADDVAQRVFIALARKAPVLQHHATLAGWLFQAARFEASRTAREEARRQAREMKAGDLQEGTDAAAEVSWERLQPVLDDALAHLSEAERTAVLLRFFSGRSFPEIGQVFAIGEDGARKRVERAVDKLRDLLARRGIVAGASALGAVLDVHAAPAVAPSTCAAIAHGAWQQAATTSKLATLALTMNSTQATVAVVGAACFLAGLLVWHDTATTREAEVRRMAAQADLAASVRQRDGVSRELSAVRQQLAALPAPTPPVPTAIAAPARPTAYLSDPEYRAAARAAAQSRFRLEFQRLYRELGLTPAQTERFEEIMAEQDQARFDAMIAREQNRDPQEVFRRSGPAWESAMRGLLGNDGFDRLRVYLRQTAVQNFVDGIAARSSESGEPISLQQADQLIAAALANDPMFQSGKGTDPGKVNWNAVWEPAAKFLTPGQLALAETTVEVWTLQKRVSLGANPAAPGPR